MASKQTEHIGLNQWQLTDSILMEDFNADNKKIDTALATAPHIKAGSYTGTGEFGQEHPNALTFDFVPKLVLVSSRTRNKLNDLDTICWISGVESEYLNLNIPYTTRNYTVVGNTFCWYTSGSVSSAGHQLNANNTVYYYLAIG